MKYLLTIILAVGLSFNVCLAGEEPGLKDQKDKESYSFGYQFGQNLKAQQLELNLSVYTAGIRDALEGKDPLLSREEIQKMVSEIQARFEAARQKQLQEVAEASLAQGKAFLEQNGKKEGIKTLSSGLQYKVVTEGSGKTAKATDDVMVNYKGAFIDGTEFANSYSAGKPVTFQVASVIGGWKEALQSMKEGSKWEVFIPPELGYGDRGVGPIPPNSTLIFEIELISVK